MKSYIGIESLKNSLELTGPELDARLLLNCESVSEIIDILTGRDFSALSETRYFDGDSPLDIDDLITVTTFQTDEDGDLDYDNTLTANTDYILYPYQKYPKTRVLLNSNSSYTCLGSGIKSAKIQGLWGHAKSATPYLTSGATVSSIDSSSTTLTPSDMTNFQAGQTLYIETEQLYVNSKNATGLTVTRGVNGTTAASHSSKTIYIWDYPADIKKLALSLAGRLFNIEGKSFSTERLGDYSYTLQNTLLDWETAIIESYKKARLD